MPLRFIQGSLKSLSLWRRANARNVSFWTLYGGQFMSSTQLIILNYPITFFHRRSTTVSISVKRVDIHFNKKFVCNCGRWGNESRAAYKLVGCHSRWRTESLTPLRNFELKSELWNFFPKAILKRKKELTSDLDMRYYRVSKFMYVTKYFPLINW